MESRGFARLVLVSVLCLATGGFCYTIGRQSGEREGREARDQQLAERRMTAAIDTQLEGVPYLGDEGHEDDDSDGDLEVEYMEVPDAESPSRW